MPAVITASNVLCAGGRGTEQLWATVRARIACIKSSHIFDRYFDPIKMGLVPEDALGKLPDEFDSQGLSSGTRRMLQLAGPTLAAVAQDLAPGPLSVYLGLPPPDAADSPSMDNFLECLAKTSSVPIDLATSRIFRMGRAAALMALEAALVRIAQNPAETVVVGGVDTFLDLRRLAILDSEARILGPRTMDGFIPGEGAAFFVLKDASTPQAIPPGIRVKVLGAASVLDEGHLYGTAPSLGQGLANAMVKLRATLPGGVAPVASTFAGFNGENFDAKLWGVARLRHDDFFLPEMVFQHPADSIGDTGAAAGAILTVLGAHSMACGQRQSSSFVWAASDREPRGCALLST